MVNTIQNYVDGVVSAATSDEDVTVEMTYNADGNLETLTAKNPPTGDQVTRYVYGTTLSDSEIATSTLKRAEIYPDSDDTIILGNGADGIYDRVKLKYDRQQRGVEVKDQQETVHAFSFDALGRQTHDRVTALGSGVDGVVRQIGTESDVLGRKAKITSYDNPTVESGSIVNQVHSLYDDFGQLVTEYQQHGGAVNTGTSLKVQYAYADGSSSTIRLTKMAYPTAASEGADVNIELTETSEKPEWEIVFEGVPDSEDPAKMKYEPVKGLSKLVVSGDITSAHSIVPAHADVLREFRASVDNVLESRTDYRFPRE